MLYNLHDIATLLYSTMSYIQLMIRHIEHIKIRDKLPIRKAHYVGTSVVLTIDPLHVKRLAIDDMTFFIQRPTENGILLELKKFEGVMYDKEQKD